MNYFQLTSKEKPKNLSANELWELSDFMNKEENLDGKIALEMLNNIFFDRPDMLLDTFYNRDKALELFEELASKFGYDNCDECDDRVRK